MAVASLVCIQKPVARKRICNSKAFRKNRCHLATTEKRCRTVFGLLKAYLRFTQVHWKSKVKNEMCFNRMTRSNKKKEKSMLFDLSFSLISASYNTDTFISVEKQNSHAVESQNRIVKLISFVLYKSHTLFNRTPYLIDTIVFRRFDSFNI